MLFFNEKFFFRKIRTILDIENWLWKSEIGIFWSLLIQSGRWSIKNIFIWKSAIFHPIKQPFDAEAAKKFLKVIYNIEAIHHKQPASYSAAVAAVIVNLAKKLAPKLRQAKLLLQLQTIL